MAPKHSRISMLAAMRERWKPTRATSHLNLVGLIETIEGLHQFRDENAEEGALSQKGLQAAVRTHAKDKVVKAIVTADAALAKARKAVQAQRDGLLPPAPDPKDFASAILRSDMRRHLLSLAPAERIGLILSDHGYDQAAREGPASLSGLDAKTFAELEQRQIASANPEAMADIEAGEEALTAFSAVLKAGLGAIREVCEFATDPEVGQFIELCAPDRRTIDDAVDSQERSWAKHLVDSSIHRLDSSERKQLRDQLFNMDLDELNGQIDPGAAA